MDGSAWTLFSFSLDSSSLDSNILLFARFGPPDIAVRFRFGLIMVSGAVTITTSGEGEGGCSRESRLY